MNTNNNVYTIIYTTLIVVVVAALLAFVSQSLKGRQEANEKAETISQMLTAAQYGTKAELDRLSNAEKLAKYGDEIERLFGMKTIVPTVPFPRIKLHDLYDELEKRYGYTVPEEEKIDLSTDAEKLSYKFAMEEYGHEFLFGSVFMATDPVTAAQTETGKWIYGFLIGALAVVVRLWNPGYMEGMMLAILFMNTMAPLIDHCVVTAHVNRRAKRVKTA